MYVPEEPPDEYDPEFLRAELRRVSAAFEVALDLVSARVPAKPREGMVRYFDGSRGDPGSGEGLYVYLSTGWTKAT